MTYRDILREIAFDNYGFVTTRAAVEAGVLATELPKISSRGGLQSVAYGLYRVTEALYNHPNFTCSTVQRLQQPLDLSLANSLQPTSRSRKSN